MFQAKAVDKSTLDLLRRIIENEKCSQLLISYS